MSTKSFCRSWLYNNFGTSIFDVFPTLSDPSDSSVLFLLISFFFEDVFDSDCAGVELCLQGAQNRSVFTEVFEKIGWCRIISFPRKAFLFNSLSSLSSLESTSSFSSSDETLSSAYFVEFLLKSAIFVFLQLNNKQTGHAQRQ